MTFWLILILFIIAGLVLAFNYYRWDELPPREKL